MFVDVQLVTMHAAFFLSSDFVQGEGLPGVRSSVTRTPVIYLHCAAKHAALLLLIVASFLVGSIPVIFLLLLTDLCTYR